MSYGKHSRSTDFKSSFQEFFFFVECYVHDHAAAENNTGNLNPVPIVIAVTNTDTEVMYTVIAKHFEVDKHNFGNGFWSLPLIM